MLHRLVRPGPVAQLHDDKGGGVERLGTGQRVAVVGIDRAVRIEREEDGALEAMTLAENLRGCGSASSLRYSSSPEMSTTCGVFAPPEGGSETSVDCAVADVSAAANMSQ